MWARDFTRLARAALIGVVLVSGGCGGASHGGEASTTGSPGGLPANAVARVGGKIITTAELDRWMRALSGSDFYSIVHQKAPVAFATYPPTNESCAAGLSRVVRNISAGRTQLGSAHFAATCRQWNEAVKRQALTRLIGLAVLNGLDAEVGVIVSPNEVQQRKNQKFKTAAALEQYLSLRDWPMAIEVAELEEEVLSSRLRAVAMAKYNSQELVKFADEGTKKWTARTICRKGFTIGECSGYKPSKEGPSAAILMEKIAAYKAPVKVAPDINCHNKKGKHDGLACRPEGKPQFPGAGTGQ